MRSILYTVLLDCSLEVAVKASEPKNKDNWLVSRAYEI
uniref:Uncharacterized protein n=1 Tax=Nelumbo nucifera TaxID=4432 RepID=A0A822YIA7_NELNU|nr:TPA_asm: hypothetical protein HUJ06_009860 [Nelumbo nucifera]